MAPPRDFVTSATTTPFLLREDEVGRAAADAHISNRYDARSWRHATANAVSACASPHRRRGRASSSGCGTWRHSTRPAASTQRDRELAHGPDAAEIRRTAQAADAGPSSARHRAGHRRSARCPARIHSALSPPRSSSCRAAISIRCDTTSDCSALPMSRSCGYPSPRKSSESSIWLDHACGAIVREAMPVHKTWPALLERTRTGFFSPSSASA